MGWRLAISAVVGAGILFMGASAFAQTGSSAALIAPSFDSGAAAGSLSDGNFNTPEADGRPGVKFFALAVQAFRKGDYAHAIDMYKVAASWAYKPAEYNLGVMYFKGQGVPVDRARGAAWMVLAAERGGPRYGHARDLMVTVLDKQQFARTDEIWRELKGTYGDAVALRRAKAQWAWVKSQQTGSRVGSQAGNLQVGVLDAGHRPKGVGMHGKSASVATNGFSLMQGGSVDGALAYRQFQKSSDSYDPVFLKNPGGTVTVQPLQTIRPGHDSAKPSTAATADEPHS